MANAPGAVVVISSHVARGSVGNRAMAFALERLGFTVWAAPTVILPHHPGHGAAERIAVEDGAFESLLHSLIESSGAANIAGIVSGYLASPGQARAVAALVNAVKTARPAAVYLCDPVIGDAAPGGPGRAYVGEAVAAAIRDILLPLADIATPNAFECGWLVGGDTGADLALQARGLGTPAVLVTSAPALMRGHIGTLLVEGDAAFLIEHPAVATPAKGTGDLLAALLLARRLQGYAWPKAAQIAVASTFEIVAGTAKAGADELLLAELQQALAQPRASVTMRRLGRSPDA